MVNILFYSILEVLNIIFNDRLNLIMQKIQSDKKNFRNFSNQWNSVSYLEDFINKFGYLFQVARHNQIEKAHQYIKGLLTLEKGKANPAISGRRRNT